MALRHGPGGALRADYGQAGVAFGPPQASLASTPVHSVQIGTTGTVLGADWVSAGSPAAPRNSWVKLTPAGQPDTGFDLDGTLYGLPLPAGYRASRWLVDRQGRWVTIDTGASDVVVTRLRGE